MRDIIAKIERFNLGFEEVIGTHGLVTWTLLERAFKVYMCTARARDWRFRVSTQKIA